ncbi:hypothetical protein FVQ98_11455 [Ottowia sp. GY511]|uniref:Choice-of-anchor U domain-containing protein n=1 Tax=Ottowia flava TaxID=2675430 RepID=A0ABW4L206_9BURK|nr:choice-of-anchor U domain-containing protein [Ottowia sp. GY511]TXK27287.1 hypothetical protein FVQ98_11455 [Ottowia sp. GY511]
MKPFIETIVVALGMCALFPAHAASSAQVVVANLGQPRDTCSGGNVVSGTIQATNIGATGVYVNFTVTAPNFVGHRSSGDGPLAAGGPIGYGFSFPSAWGLNAAPDTPVTLTVYTYTDTAMTHPVYSSAFTWNCTTGVGGPVVNTDLSAVDGTCGAATGVAASSPPTANLCQVGTASAVSGSGPWTWSCAGSQGGSAAACSAPLAGNKIYSAPSPTGTGTITAALSGGGDACGFAATTRYIATEPSASPSTPAGVAFPHGLFDFSATQCSNVEGGAANITLEVAYPQTLPANTQYYKWGPTPDNRTPHWYVMPASIVRNTATFTITDGGLGDDDLQTNGTIVDQGGAGTGTAISTVPTASVWALAAAALMLGLSGRRRLRYRRSKP